MGCHVKYGETTFIQLDENHNHFPILAGACLDSQSMFSNAFLTTSVGFWANISPAF